MKTCFDTEAKVRSEVALGMTGFKSSQFLQSVLSFITMTTLARFNTGKLGINIFQNMDRGKSEKSLKQGLMD